MIVRKGSLVIGEDCENMSARADMNAAARERRDAEAVCDDDGEWLMEMAVEDREERAEDDVDGRLRFGPSRHQQPPDASRLCRLCNAVHFLAHKWW